MLLNVELGDPLAGHRIKAPPCDVSPHRDQLDSRAGDWVADLHNTEPSPSSALVTQPTSTKGRLVLPAGSHGVGAPTLVELGIPASTVGPPSPLQAHSGPSDVPLHSVDDSDACMGTSGGAARNCNTSLL